MGKPETLEMTSEEAEEARQVVAQGSDPEAILKMYEDEALKTIIDILPKRISKKLKTPVDRLQIKKALSLWRFDAKGKKKPRPKKSNPEALHEVLNCVRFVREYLSTGDIKNAVLETIHLGAAANRANLPLIIEGAKFKNRQVNNRGKRTTYGDMQKDEIKVRNQKIYEDCIKYLQENPFIKESQWAIDHCHDYGLKESQARSVLREHRKNNPDGLLSRLFHSR